MSLTFQPALVMTGMLMVVAMTVMVFELSGGRAARVDALQTIRVVTKTAKPP